MRVDTGQQRQFSQEHMNRPIDRAQCKQLSVLAPVKPVRVNLTLTIVQVHDRLDVLDVLQLIGLDAVVATRGCLVQRPGDCYVCQVVLVGS